MIRETVPWIKILADNEVSFRDKRVHLRDFILKNKDLLVLKPANMYGGKNVYIGLETSQEIWERIMNQQIEDESWVVQEYVDIPTDIYPEIGDGIFFKRKFVNINPFALQGKYGGAITRVSDSAVINVSAGGGLVPTLGQIWPTQNTNNGTKAVNRDIFEPAITCFKSNLCRAKISDHPLRISENEIFFGGYLSRHLSRIYHKRLLVLALEYKKIFMDERTGTLYQDVPDKLIRDFNRAVDRAVETCLSAL